MNIANLELLESMLQKHKKLLISFSFCYVNYFSNLDFLIASNVDLFFFLHVFFPLYIQLVLFFPFYFFPFLWLVDILQWISLYSAHIICFFLLLKSVSLVRDFPSAMIELIPDGCTGMLWVFSPVQMISIFLATGCSISGTIKGFCRILMSHLSVFRSVGLRNLNFQIMILIQILPSCELLPQTPVYLFHLTSLQNDCIYLGETHQVTSKEKKDLPPPTYGDCCLDIPLSKAIVAILQRQGACTDTGQTPIKILFGCQV